MADLQLNNYTLQHDQIFLFIILDTIWLIDISDPIYNHWNNSNQVQVHISWLGVRKVSPHLWHIYKAKQE